MSNSQENLPQSEKIANIDRRVSVKSKERVTSDNGKPDKIPFITMELPMLLAMISITLNIIAVNNVVMYRTCIHVKKLGEEICGGFLAPDKFNVSQEVETEVQQYMTRVQNVKAIIDSITPAILAFFLGAWSDRHGRKPLVVWALFGLALSQILVVVYSSLSFLGPWWFIVTGIPNAFLGYMVLFTGAMCYMSDISTPENRSMRLTMVQVILSLGQVIGHVSSSFLVQAVGSFGLLSISASSATIALLYTVFFIKESLKGATKGGITSVIKFSLVKDMFRVVFKRRTLKRRTQILMLIAANTLSVFITFGINSLDYLYVRNKIQWSMREYSIFSAVATTIGGVGGFIGVVCVQRLLSIPDLAFVAFAFFSAAVEFMVKAFATEGWHFYLSVCISVFSNLAGPLVRSVLSKMILVSDIAKVFMLMGAIEAITPLIAPTIFLNIYNVTLQDFPGAVYILSFTLYVCCLVMTLTVQYFMSRAARATKLDEGDYQK